MTNNKDNLNNISSSSNTATDGKCKTFVINNELDKEKLEKFFKEVLDKNQIVVKIPSACPDLLTKLDKTLEENQSIKEKINKDDEKVLSLEIATTSFETVDTLKECKKCDIYSNNVNLEGKELTIKTLLPKNVNTENAALILLKSKLGSGVYERIPLINSGFWITLEPLTAEEIVLLMEDIAKEFNEIGKNIGILGYSHYEVLYHKVIMKHLLPHIKDSSLDVPVTEILDYISINDLDTLLLALAKSFYPKGYKHGLIACKNSLVIDDKTKTPKCNYKANVTLDLDKLLFINDSIFNQEEYSKLKETLLKTKPNSLSIEDVKSYQENLPNTVKNISITKNDLNLVISLKVPSISKYLEYGELFINEVKTKVTQYIKDLDLSKIEEKVRIKYKDLPEEEFREKVAEEYERYKELVAKNLEAKILSLLNIKVYNHYVNKVIIDGVIVDNYDSINSVLLDIRNDEEIRNKLFKSIKDLINESSLTLVGTPNFTCPNCGEEQGPQPIIPLSVVNHFFILINTKYQSLVT